MFTGLIETVGTIRAWHRSGESTRLTVASDLPMHELAIGESIAVSGACLTVVSFGDGCFGADLSPETLQRSTLVDLGPGSPVNLERAMRLSDRLGGHLVTGHIDAVATVRERLRDGNAVRFTFSCDEKVGRLLVEKGSVAIDGISLTVNVVGAETFGVTVIPHTMEATTLCHCRPGSRVNVETDLIGKYVERLLGGGRKEVNGGRLDRQFLANHGFM